MKLLLYTLILGALLSLPFAFLKRPWAIKLWSRIRLLFVIYALVILAAGITRLVLNWDNYY